jgi:hypothetical protein
MKASGKELLERNNQIMVGLIDGMVKHLEVFEQKKVSGEDIKQVEAYKNGAGFVVKANNALRDNLAAIGALGSKANLDMATRQKTA